MAVILAACGGGKDDAGSGLVYQSVAAPTSKLQFPQVNRHRTGESTNKGPTLPSTLAPGSSVAGSAAPAPSLTLEPSIPAMPDPVTPVAPPPPIAPAEPVAPAAPGGNGRPPGIVVDTSSLPTPQPGVSVPMLTDSGVIPPTASDPFGDGAFRLLCNFSKMAFDDPIVFPGQPGVSHHHTFFGNTGIDSSTTSENIRLRGKATCRGGTINLGGYWMPSMIDTATNKPVAPISLLLYYKTGLWTYMNDRSVLQPLPKGLKIISGFSGNKVASTASGGFQCFMTATGETRPGTGGPSIPTACQPGDVVRARISFPQCWDGVNLDSPDHKSHMAYPEQFWSGDPQRQYRCPLSHPVVLPQITYNVDFPVTVAGSTQNWRLASDDYDRSAPGGYSMHADYMNGWDPAISDLWGVKCLRERRDCGSANLGDGRVTAEYQGN
ncbi:MAG: DUF1996 domain-containing protein [Dokdonella sp.]